MTTVLLLPACGASDDEPSGSASRKLDPCSLGDVTVAGIRLGNGQARSETDPATGVPADICSFDAVFIVVPDHEFTDADWKSALADLVKHDNSSRAVSVEGASQAAITLSRSGEEIGINLLKGTRVVYLAFPLAEDPGPKLSKDQRLALAREVVRRM